MSYHPDNIWTNTPAARMVADFHIAFDHPVANECIAVEDLDTPLTELRMRLITEEYQELLKAREERDLVGFIDALQDLKYVIYGAELALGISSEEHFEEVHSANMRKLGPDGKPIYREDGKILKPADWTGPNHEQLLDVIGHRGKLY